ncbi:hypothetical protein IV498_08665 [Paenarthrobacter sp. Z7-10]|uniref:DUF5719 family protein n=1 Tax=Paenarthrobacter sp. Z7-10 TaxID=2787635 RepID=UPI0022A9581C|nr:DUF5719 family protein [Paenarthrobacter sp. Z7-10]MCZ2403252.1 hypothetical protein [Paenarthrobacter sp. Z7-10]
MLLSSERGALPKTVLDPLGPGGPLATLAPAPSAAEAAAAAQAVPSQPDAPDSRSAAILALHSVGAPSVLRAEPLGGRQTTANGLLTYTAVDGDLAGLAAANCQAPSNEAWLMGASTTVGRTAVLNIVNPSSTAATVSLDLYGDQGVLPAPGAKGLLVPAGTKRSIVLAGLAADQKNLAVRLKSTGGPVAASIQQSVLRGLTPGGVEILNPVAGPAVRQVITGVDVQDPKLAADLTAQAGYADAAAALQVVVSSGADALVQVKVYGTSGQSPLPHGGVFTAKAGSVSQLPLTGLPAGTYTVEARSDSAFAATARVVHGSKAGQRLDFGFSAAAEQLGSGSLIILPKDAASRLSFGVPEGRAKVALVPVTSAGKLLPVKTVDVAGGTTVLVDPLQLGGSSAAGFIASATGDPVYGAQLFTGSGKDNTAVSVLGIPRSVAGEQSVNVILGY